MATTELLTIEVAYALPGQQTLLTVKLPAGSTVAQAIEQSGMLARFGGRKAPVVTACSSVARLESSKGRSPCSASHSATQNPN